jgi:menaquinone-dependent protoporphyrinogen IX oxidase
VTTNAARPQSIEGGAIMPRILVVYGTTYGHTATIGNAIAETLSFRQATVDVAEASSVTPAPAA